MHISKRSIPAKIDIPTAVVRQSVGFGDPTPFSPLGAEYLSLAAGTDIAPLLAGLADDRCDVPHWGYLISGELIVTYADGTEETCRGDDMFFWPPHHTVRVTLDTELVMFSPHDEHAAVLDHMLVGLAG